MQPFLIGQRVLISDAATLSPHLQEATGLSPEHLAQAGKSAAIRNIYVTTRARNQYFFYALDGSTLLWPHAAIAIPNARRLTVNVARPMEPRAPRSPTAVSESLSERPVDRGGRDWGLGDGSVVWPAAHLPDARNTTEHGDTESAKITSLKLYVGGMSYSMSDSALIRLFARFGDIKAVRSEERRV